MQPRAIHIITTETGRNRLEQHLIGPNSVWHQLWAELFPDDPLVQPHIHTPDDADEDPVEDLRTRRDDRRIADLCYTWTHRLTRGEEPLIGSISGGRKTMSAHLMTAFSIYGRPQDHLVHILVQPEKYEHSSFFYPTAETPDARLDLIDVPFPRLYRWVKDEILKNLPADEHRLQDILTHIEGYHLPDTPSILEVQIGSAGRGKSRVALYTTDALLLAEGLLPARTLTTLLVLLEHIDQEGGVITYTTLIKRAQQIAEERDLLEAYCYKDDLREKPRKRVARVQARQKNEPTACMNQRWADEAAISQALHDLEQTLTAAYPALAEHLAFPRSGRPVELRGPRLALRLHTDQPIKSWPFNYLPRPTRLPPGTR